MDVTEEGTEWGRDGRWRWAIGTDIEDERAGRKERAKSESEKYSWLWLWHRANRISQQKKIQISHLVLSFTSPPHSCSSFAAQWTNHPHLSSRIRSYILQASQVVHAIIQYRRIWWLHTSHTQASHKTETQYISKYGIESGCQRENDSAVNFYRFAVKSTGLRLTLCTTIKLIAVCSPWPASALFGAIDVSFLSPFCAYTHSTTHRRRERYGIVISRFPLQCAGMFVIF